MSLFEKTIKTFKIKFTQSIYKWFTSPWIYVCEIVLLIVVSSLVKSKCKLSNLFRKKIYFSQIHQVSLYFHFRCKLTVRYSFSCSFHSRIRFLFPMLQYINIYFSNIFSTDFNDFWEWFTSALWNVCNSMISIVIWSLVK